MKCDLSCLVLRSCYLEHSDKFSKAAKALELVMSWCWGWMAGAQSCNGQLLYTVWLKCPASCLLKALEKVTLCNCAVFSSLEGCEGISARMNCGSGEAFEPPPTITCAVATRYGQSPRLSNQSEVLLPRLWATMHNTFGWIGIFQIVNHLCAALCCNILSHPFLDFTKYSR